jgi:DNA end-binding protein Ku
LADLVQAKIEGRKIKPQKRPEPTKVVSLLDALRQSAKGDRWKPSAKSKLAAKSQQAPRKKAS